MLTSPDERMVTVLKVLKRSASTRKGSEKLAVISVLLPSLAATDGAVEAVVGSEP